ncbi:unnamed protein product [Notodromas monacha]|uniref:Anti-proliferative protein domain-containing protein n=1 Tax=Notodromas monacha TaxID=399045 RepID=A0A7R9BBY6_9CRUS|nr:unnamed protein product [Notodromas monacha]CAG0912476.1 unnamed protein product [Notodromas monacha]
MAASVVTEVRTCRVKPFPPVSHNTSMDLYFSDIAPEMKREIFCAIRFLMQLVTKNPNAYLISEPQIKMFEVKMANLLEHKYGGHWFPTIPSRGSAYRCIRINGLLDPLVSEAGELSGVPNHVLQRVLPADLTLWIDPNEVSYRIGESGSICHLMSPQIYGDENMLDPFEGYKSPGLHTPRNRASPILDHGMRFSKRTPPASPVGSPYNYVTKSKMPALAQKLEFAQNAKNINHLCPLTAYFC